MVVMMMLMIVEMVIVMFGGFGLLRQTETQTTPDFSRFWPGCSWSVEPELLVLRERIELSASPLPRECSTTELPQRLIARPWASPSPCGTQQRDAHEARPLAFAVGDFGPVPRPLNSRGRASKHR
jgi:hypothetical protein